jgi:hypothetical protein
VDLPSRSEYVVAVSQEPIESDLVLHRCVTPRLSQVNHSEKDREEKLSEKVVATAQRKERMWLLIRRYVASIGQLWTVVTKG